MITEKEFAKYNHIDNLITNCILGKSNVTNAAQSYELLCIRLNNLKIYSESILKNIDLVILIDKRINYILNNTKLLSVICRK